MSDTGLTVPGMTELPRRYDVTITVDRDGGDHLNPAEFAVAADVRIDPWPAAGTNVPEHIGPSPLIRSSAGTHTCVSNPPRGKRIGNRPLGLGMRRTPMTGDIKLDGDWVVVEGNWTRIRTLDLMLDAPSRRITQSGQRRALVHDFTDRLTINYASDYPNGVYISGETSMEKLHVTGTVLIGEGVLSGAGGFVDLAITPKLLLGKPFSEEPKVDVGAELKSLRDEIEQLKARVDALEHP